jgi:hypothetical protein
VRANGEVIAAADDVHLIVAGMLDHGWRRMKSDRIGRNAKSDVATAVVKRMVPLGSISRSRTALSARSARSSF